MTDLPLVQKQLHDKTLELHRLKTIKLTFKTSSSGSGLDSIMQEV